jgi:hypothetical protein
MASEGKGAAIERFWQPEQVSTPSALTTLPKHLI